MKGALGAARQEARVEQALQVMAECGGRQIDVLLDLARGGTAVAALNHEAHDLEPNRVPERRQLLRVPFEFRAHALLLIFSKYARKKHFEKIGTILDAVGAIEKDETARRDRAN